MRLTLQKSQPKGEEKNVPKKLPNPIPLKKINGPSFTGSEKSFIHVLHNISQFQKNQTVIMILTFPSVQLLQL